MGTDTDLCPACGRADECEDCADDTCPACDGDGYRMGFDDERGCSRIVPCRHCRATGHAPTLPNASLQRPPAARQREDGPLEGVVGQQED